MNERGAREVTVSRVRMTSGQLGPKSGPDPLPPGKPKRRRLRFDNEPPAYDLPPPDNPDNPNPHDPADTSGQHGPKSGHDPAPTHNPDPTGRAKRRRLLFYEDKPPHDAPRNRLRFEDEDRTDGEAPAYNSPDTSGQVVPKLRQQSNQAENLRRDGEAPVADLPGPKANTKAAQENKHLAKSKLRMDDAEAKLNAAQEKLAAQQPPAPPGTIRQLGQKARFYTWLYVHKKISQVEHENVGTEAAHKTELAAEGVYRGTSRFVKHRIRTRPTRQVRKHTRRTARARANHAYQKLLHDNPALRKKALARFFHRQRLKVRYARQAKQATQATKHGASMVTRITAKVGKAAIALVKGNPKVWIIVIFAFMMFFMLQSCMGMMATIGNSLGGVVAGTTNLAEDEDITAATVAYTAWEADLRYQILNVEYNHPDFDEYRFEIGSISHDPFALVAFLTAMYDDFTYAEVRPTLYEIFNEQYNLEFIPYVEIHTRMETRTGTGTGTGTSTGIGVDEDGEEYEYEFSYAYEFSYEYEVEVEYEWHILYVILESRSFTEVITARMDEEQTERFDLLMLTKGNRQHLQSPFGFNWLPFVSSLYGYRIHPIHGGLSMHWGIDIALPEGTPILSGQNGTVIFAGNAGGYGLLVVIDDGEGLVSRYAHCSFIYVSVGQEVSAGDVIARVGNTGDSTGPHLHLEILKNGRHVNPLIFTVTNHHLGL